MSIRDVSCIPGVLGAQGMPKGPSESGASPCLVHAPFVLTRRGFLFIKKKVFTGRHLWPKIPSVIGIRDPAEHSRRRRPWNRAFSTASAKEFVPIIQSRVQQLGDALVARQGQTVDLAEWMSFFT